MRCTRTGNWSLTSGKTDSAATRVVGGSERCLPCACAFALRVVGSIQGHGGFEDMTAWVEGQGRPGLKGDVATQAQADDVEAVTPPTDRRHRDARLDAEILPIPSSSAAADVAKP